MSKVRVKSRCDLNIKGKVRVVSMPKTGMPYLTNDFLESLISEEIQPDWRLTNKVTNKVTNEVAEMFASYLEGDPITFSHIYGQWGEPIDFSEGGGPFFTPAADNQVSDLDTATIHTTDAQAPIIFRKKKTEPGQSSFVNNVITVIAPLTKNDGKIYVGAGLVARRPNQDLLLAHVALDGILKEATHDLLIIWDWVFSNSS